MSAIWPAPNKPSNPEPQDGLPCGDVKGAVSALFLFEGKAMINKIVRTPTRAEGGITDDEKARMAVISQKWIDVAMRTDPIEPNKIVPAVHALYEAAGLKKPRVVIVPSPLVMAFAYGASAWIWHCRKQDRP